MQHAFRGSWRLSAFLSTMALSAVAFAAFSPVGSAHTLAKHRSKQHWSGGASVTTTPWGTIPTGQAVNLYTLRNGRGMSVNITDFGGVVQSINVPDRSGTTKDVALGFPTADDYYDDFTQGATSTPWPLSGGSGDTYFGAIIGRYANRIANASFTMTCSSCSNNGVTYHLDANNGPNTLHGGYLGWNTAVWNATPMGGPGYAALKLTNSFPAGEGCLAALTANCSLAANGGFPANVTVTVVYTLTPSDGLKISYDAKNTESPGGAATVINLTNHTYFNLGGEDSGTVYNQELAINSDSYQPTNVNQIPTGAFVPVKGTAFDFTYLHKIGLNIRNTTLPDGGGQAFPQLVIAHGYDHNWVLNGSGYRPSAFAVDKKTGITLTEYTDQPGVQFYTGNFLVGDLIGTSGHTYRQGDGFTLESQHYPDSPNHIGQSGWPSVVLNAGQTFTSTTAYQFGVARGGFSSHHRF
jgi:aldose 1-epimerase